MLVGSIFAANAELTAPIARIAPTTADGRPIERKAYMDPRVADLL
jgi:hypothetical protein